MPNAPVVVFDFGGVLIEWNPRYLYRKLFVDEAAMEHFLATVCTPEWNAKQDAGRPFVEAVDELLALHPQHADMIRVYHTRWEEMVPYAIEDTVRVLAAVREAGYRLAALSNWSAETFPIMQGRYDFLSWFDEIVLSGAERCAKPDRRIFEILLQRLGIPASDCIFIDDSEKNILAAQSLGIRTVHFQSAAALPDQLRAHGVIL